MLNDFGYYRSIIENLEKVNATQEENIKAAASLMADAIENDRLINVYGGGGHTTLPVGEMFFRAGGLSCINPLMETGLSVFNQALKYLELERTVNYGASIIKYYDLKKDDVLIIFHNIGINPATIDAAMEAKKNGVKIIAVSSEAWQKEMPEDHFIRHPNKMPGSAIEGYKTLIILQARQYIFAVFKSPRHPYTIALLSAVPTTKSKKSEPIEWGAETPAPAKRGGCPFHTRCFMAQEVCAKVVPPMKETEKGHFTACHFAEISTKEKLAIAREKGAKK